MELPDNRMSEFGALEWMKFDWCICWDHGADPIIVDHLEVTDWKDFVVNSDYALYDNDALPTSDWVDMIADSYGVCIYSAHNPAYSSEEDIFGIVTGCMFFENCDMQQCIDKMVKVLELKDTGHLSVTELRKLDFF